LTHGIPFRYTLRPQKNKKERPAIVGASWQGRLEGIPFTLLPCSYLLSITLLE
jgi:hypothetical protein